jgi:hypothetical protein
MISPGSAIPAAPDGPDPTSAASTPCSTTKCRTFVEQELGFGIKARKRFEAAQWISRPHARDPSTETGDEHECGEAWGFAPQQRR